MRTSVCHRWHETSPFVTSCCTNRYGKVSFIRDWDLVTIGHSDAVVRRSPDGRSFAKTVTTPAACLELIGERDRLRWLSTTSVNAPHVLDWQEEHSTATLVTAALPGKPASALSCSQAPAATRALAEFLGVLHALPIDDCPFRRPLEVTVAAAEANTRGGTVDEQDFDEARRGTTAERLLDRLLADKDRAQSLERADLRVCHGDLCLPNVLLNPRTFVVTGIVDVGRLGVADRHLDIALLTRSLESTILNPNYGPELSTFVRNDTEADPWRIQYYRLLDEFF